MIEFSKPDNILEFYNNKQIDIGWSFKEYNRSQTGKWSHNYHRYPAKFIPQLVEKIMDEYISSNNAQINDPFMGCGTTTTTAISKGFKASGTDINKIAYLITKVKSTPIEPKYLHRKIESFFEKINNNYDTQERLFLETIEATIPEDNLKRINYWFDEDTKLKLGKILSIIYNENDKNIQNFLLVGFSNILKNCSIWLQNSTKPTRDFKISDPKNVIRRQLKKMVRGNEAFYKSVPDEVRKHPNKFLNIKVGDATNQPMRDNSVDLIISSSPYVTSYEYSDLHQLSTLWLNLSDDWKNYRKKFIGSKYKTDNGKALKSRIAQIIVNKMSTKNKKISKEIEIFFLDMEEVFDETYRILKKDGFCSFVIGNTSLKGVDILNAPVFTESMTNSNLKIERIIKREIPSKILPQTRDKETGRFTSIKNSNSLAYPTEYIIIAKKE